MHSATWSWVAAATLLLSACGGKVVYEHGSGAGGAGGSASSTDSTGSSPLCSTVDPVGSVLGCSSGSGNGDECISTAVCDDQGHLWEQTCKSNSCVCSFNGVTTCICVLDGPGDFCGGTPKCCPEPWQ